MEKRIVSKMPIVSVHVDPPDKEILQQLANEERLCLSTYCRIILAKHAQENKMKMEK